MANDSDGAPQTQQGAFRRAWSEHPATMLAAVIGAVAVLIGALFPLLTKEDPRDPGEHHPTTEPGSTVAAPPPDPSSDSGTGPTADRTRPSASEQPAKASEPRWKGPVKIPVNLNSVSDTGAELDSDEPGNLVGVDDDLRGDYSTTPAVLVMTGRAAEIGKPLSKITRDMCEQRTPVEPSDPTGITAYRTGTYCFATSEGDVAAFAVTSPPTVQDIPSELTIQVVLWE